MSVEGYREKNKEPGDDEVQLTGMDLEKVRSVERS